MLNSTPGLKTGALPGPGRTCTPSSGIGQLGRCSSKNAPAWCRMSAPSITARQAIAQQSAERGLPRAACLGVQVRGSARSGLNWFTGPIPERPSPCLVRFDKNRYSVDGRAVGRPVEIRAYAERVEFWQDGKIVGQHVRAFGGDKAIYDPLHYIPVLARKPGALRNGAPFKDWELPPAIRRVQRKPGKVPNGDRPPFGTLLRNALPGSGWSRS